MTRTRTCAECIFAAPETNPNGIAGFECRRRAPMSNQVSWRGGWTFVLPDEWCGEHQSIHDIQAGDAGLSTQRVRKALRSAAVLEATGWSSPTLFRKIKEGRFPAGTKIDAAGETVVWWEDEIAKFQEDAINASRAARDT